MYSPFYGGPRVVSFKPRPFPYLCVRVFNGVFGSNPVFGPGVRSESGRVLHRATLATIPVL